jgi:putative ABC transport system substrate-binding protein
VDAFLQGLRDLGYIEGQTISIEWRFTPTGPGSRVSELAAELVALDVDLIAVETSTLATQAAAQATSTIPIVAVNFSFPVQTGVVVSLARPGGNVTGVSGIAPGEYAKHLDLLRDVVPGLTRVVTLVDPNNAGSVQHWEELRAAGQVAGVQVDRVDLQTTAELEPAFEFPAFAAAQALSLAGAAALLQPIRERVAELALQHHLAGIATSSYAEVGLLMNYGVSPTAVSRRGATYVDKILKGMKPADLPVELPTKFDFVVNLRTANALGLNIPPDVAAQVTEWIQ